MLGLDDSAAMLFIPSVGETGEDAVLGQLREIHYNIVNRHPRCQVIKHVIDRDASRADARFSRSLAGINTDVPRVIHDHIMALLETRSTWMVLCCCLGALRPGRRPPMATESAEG